MDRKDKSNNEAQALIKYISAFKRIYETEDGKLVLKFLEAANSLPSWSPGKTHDDMIFTEGQRAVYRQLLNFRTLKEE